MSGGRQQRTEATPPTVTGRVLAILGEFSAESPDLALTEISRRTGLAVSTTHRIVAELIDWGALERAPDRRYHVGYRMRQLEAAAKRHYESSRRGSANFAARSPEPADEPGILTTTTSDSV